MKGSRTKGNSEADFWLLVKSSRDSCWEWMGFRSKDGYGHLTRDRKSFDAHRFSWSLHFGPVPEGMLVCHRCDNPPCVRPDHLFIGTYADNNHDRNSKGRNPGASITSDVASAIRREWEQSPCGRDSRRPRGILRRLAAKYGTTIWIVNNIIYQNTWKQRSLSNGED